MLKIFCLDLILFVFEEENSIYENEKKEIKMVKIWPKEEKKWHFGNPTFEPKSPKNRPKFLTSRQPRHVAVCHSCAEAQQEPDPSRLSLLPRARDAHGFSLAVRARHFPGARVVLLWSDSLQPKVASATFHVAFSRLSTCPHASNPTMTHGTPNYVILITFLPTCNL